MSSIIIDSIPVCHCESRFIGTWQSHHYLPFLLSRNGRGLLAISPLPLKELPLHLLERVRVRQGEGEINQ